MHGENQIPPWFIQTSPTPSPYPMTYNLIFFATLAASIYVALTSI